MRLCWDVPVCFLIAVCMAGVFFVASVHFATKRDQAALAKITAKAKKATHSKITMARP